MRQQRRNNARGNVPFKQNATVPSLVASIVTFNNDQIVLTFGTLAPHVTLNGIPQLVRVANGETPQQANWTAPDLTLVYATPTIGNAEDFTLAAHDPAFRGSAGEYIAACTLTTAPAAATPQGQLRNNLETITNGFVAVPNADGITLNTPSPAATGDKFTVCQPSAFASGTTLTPIGSGSPVAAGTTVVFTFDGSNWQG